VIDRQVARCRVFKAAFVSALQLAQHLRLNKLGMVSVDGTKLQANASKHAAVSYARAGEMMVQLELEVQELIGRAQQAENQDNRQAQHEAGKKPCGPEPTGGLGLPCVDIGHRDLGAERGRIRRLGVAATR